MPTPHFTVYGIGHSRLCTCHVADEDGDLGEGHDDHEVGEMPFDGRLALQHVLHHDLGSTRSARTVSTQGQHVRSARVSAHGPRTVSPHGQHARFAAKGFTWVATGQPSRQLVRGLFVTPTRHWAQ